MHKIFLLILLLTLSVLSNEETVNKNEVNRTIDIKTQIDLENIKINIERNRLLMEIDLKLGKVLRIMEKDQRWEMNYKTP